MSNDFSNAQTRSRLWAPGAPEGRPRLLALWEGGSSTYDLAGRDPVVIGRSTTCQLVVSHASVSREHARFLPGAPSTIEDLGSSNGTYVGGQQLTPHTPTPIAPGELIIAGSAMVVLQSGDITQEDAAPAAGVVAKSEAMHRLFAMAERIAKSDISVLVLGETGVGKEVMARRIHEQSNRSAKAIVRINCAALSETLLESELFGHEKGAFTGALAAKPGLLEAAHGGTVFMDEVGEMPLTTQAKLLRALETREVLRVGSVKPRSIDVRFISATNRKLEDAIILGDFRRDLYFRLAGMTIEIPPLRERQAEIQSLATMFIETLSRSQGRAPPRLSGAAEQKLLEHSWPGNVRELRNVVERALVLCPGSTIGPEHLVIDAVSMALSPGVRPVASAGPHGSEPSAAPSPGGDLRSSLNEMEKQRIISALEQTDGNQTRAAALLGVSRRMLINRIEAYNLPRPRKR